MKLTGASILNADFRLESRDLYLENGKIAFSGSDADTLPLTGMTVIPGLIDLHIHGYAGISIATADGAALAEMSRALLRAGTTSYLPTVGSREPSLLRASLRTLSTAIEEPSDGCAEPLGVYLEAPYISSSALGAISEKIVRPFSSREFDEYNALSGGHIRIVTLAPEIKENADAIPYLAERGILAAIGHTAADAETTRAAIAAGARHATHLFNAMRGLHHREPGTVGAVLDSSATAELIADGHHIDPAVLRLAFRLLSPDRAALVSDLSTYGGLPDGEYESPDVGAVITVRDGAARLASGALAGNISPLLTLVRRAVSFGIPFPDAVRAATLTPARILGCADRKGCIAEGMDADLLVLDDALSLRYVIKGGRVIKV